MVYCSPNHARRYLLWDQLTCLASLLHGDVPWVLTGDFNAYTAVHEKAGGSRHNWNSIKAFIDCIQQCHLLDLPFRGPLHTWQRGNLKERIDRVMSNASFQMMFPEVLVTHGLAFKSDHRVIVTTLRPVFEVRANRKHVMFQAA